MMQNKRLIALEGTSNFRDAGGYETNTGEHVRWGVIYRSGALFRLTQGDWSWMSERRIAAICDLRSLEERELAPTQWLGGDHTAHVGEAYPAERILGRRARTPAEHGAGVGEMEESFYAVFADLLGPSFGAIFKALGDGHTPIIVHCTAGQDRTGLAIGLLLSALDVPREVILEDYVLSTQWRRPEFEIDRAAMAAREHDNAMARYFQDSFRARGAEALKPRRLFNRHGRPLLADALAGIEMRWGSIENYLQVSAGVNPELLAQVRANCLE